MTQPASGLEFPCSYPVKVMVESGSAVHDQVLAVVAAYASFSRSDDVRSRASRNGRFESITVSVRAESREQLERLYQALNDLNVVKMLL